MFTFTRAKTTERYPAKTRVVKTTRWIHTNELKVGMYVRELDRPWEETDFMFQGFVVEDIKQLQSVQEQAEYVSIVSEKIAKVNADSPNRLVGAVS